MDLISRTVNSALQEGKFSAEATYKKILEVNGENMNQKDKKNLKKKLKRKQKKIKRQNPGFAHDQPEESDQEDQEEEELVGLKPSLASKPEPPKQERTEPLEIIEDPFE
jgi:hypothetical protein